jgi:LmbE family N-acetylglucosaminyl deacetylase
MRRGAAPVTLVILSPHLDDAVMSLGGTLHRLAGLGIATRIVTIFAGDPAHPGPPGFWDAKRRLATASATFEARRAEDSAATKILGAEPVWLPLLDASYGSPRDPDRDWELLRPHLRDATAVIVPGAPLTHSDHRYTTRLVLGHICDSVPVFFYSEQPYCSRPRYVMGFVRGDTPTELGRQIGCDVVWTTCDLDRESRRAKRDAVACYAGELRALGPRARLDSFVARVMHREKIGNPAGQQLPPFLNGAR